MIIYCKNTLARRDLASGHFAVLREFTGLQDWEEEIWMPLLVKLSTRYVEGIAVLNFGGY